MWPREEGQIRKCNQCRIMGLYCWCQGILTCAASSIRITCLLSVLCAPLTILLVCQHPDVPTFLSLDLLDLDLSWTTIASVLLLIGHWPTASLPRSASRRNVFIAEAVHTAQVTAVPSVLAASYTVSSMQLLGWLMALPARRSTT